MSQQLNSNRLDNRGGANRGQGAKPKYNEATTTVSFRVPLSSVPEIKQLVKDKLKEKLIKFEV